MKGGGNEFQGKNGSCNGRYTGDRKRHCPGLCPLRSTGRGQPGPLTQRLLKAWGDMVGVDIVQQAMSHLPKSAERMKS